VRAREHSARDEFVCGALEPERDAPANRRFPTLRAMRRKFVSAARPTMEGAIMDSSHTQGGLEQRSFPPRKIHLDCDVYCPHSLRESAGDVDCDHDFEIEPTVEQQGFAIWECTKCGRAFKFDVWDSAPGTSDPLPEETLEFEP
jgi:hypothetical protein